MDDVLVWRFSTSEEAAVAIAGDLRRGRAFVAGAEGSADRTPCILRLSVGTEAYIDIDSEVVFCQPDGAGKGLGLELVDPKLEEKLDELAGQLEVERAKSSKPSNIADPAESSPPSAKEPSQSKRDAPNGAPFRNVHERVRRLSVRERDKLARSGTLAERTALERAFGGSVWESLLQNPQLTGGEVARIAKNGTVPAPLIGLIASNAGWLSRPEVRRSLLQNPRLPANHAERVLRATPKHELKLVVQQAIYPPRVRMVARKMLQG